MLIYTYDGTFEGFLTGVFDCYSRKDFPVDIQSRVGEQRQLFAEKRDIPTNSVKADRVWKGIQKKLSGNNNQLVFYAFLSEETGN